MTLKHYEMHITDVLTGQTIATAGGKVYVAKAGDAQKETLYTKAGAALANPITPTNGKIEFWTLDTVATVDLYVQAASGHFVVQKGVAASGPNQILIDKGQINTVMVIPFSIADTTANTETNTGFSVPTGSLVLPTGVGAQILTEDSGITVDFGTLSSASGDADGFIDGLSTATAGIVKATLANGALTLGALLYVQDSANAGDEAPEANASSSGRAITYTLASGADTAEGFFLLPITVPVA